MNSSAELHVSLGVPLAGAHLGGAAQADGRAAGAPARSATDATAQRGELSELERAQAEITRLRAELDARNAADGGWSKLTARVDAELAKLVQTVKAQLDALGSDVVGLALAAAGKILHTELTSPQFDLGAVVAEALDRVVAGARADSPVRIRASNQDLATLDRSTRMHPTASERVQLEADPALGPSQVVLECDLRRVVVDVKAEFERLKAALSAEDDPHG
jgi:flagellar biosynthesis/type III secretory pathway protein FliH